MSSTSEFTDQHSQSDSSAEEDYPGAPSRPASALSQRKRRRSSSVDSLRARKRHLDGRYNDAYRTLYNGVVNAAATRFDADATFQPYASIVGVSNWSAHEKAMFFAALEKLGRDDVPGIAKAIASKSISETRQFLLLIQEAYAAHNSKPKNVKFTLADIPAALEVGVEYQDRLELAGDALAWYQERFEAKQEQERYGKYWLVTPKIAGEIDEAIGASRSKAASPVNGNEDEKPESHQDASVSQVLSSVPDAQLLNPTALLHLSKYYFMNPSPTVSYPWPHWTELVSEVAAEPSIYRSAFGDLYTLVVSLTRRLVQTAIIQATARIRTQGWRLKKGILPYVKRRDVLTTVDILGLNKNSSERWRGVARRCGLRVQKGIRRVGGRGEKRSIEVPWDEVERLLESTNILAEPPSTDAETAGLTSGTDEDTFKSRAVRGGTPLPAARVASMTESEEENQFDVQCEDDESSVSDEYQPPADQASDASMLDGETAPAEASHDLSEDELQALETFDQTARREEERHLWSLLDDSHCSQDASSKLKAETAEPEARSLALRPTRNPSDDWRTWIQYRAPWEELRTLTPASSFYKDIKWGSIATQVASIERQESDSDLETGRSTARDGSRRHDQTRGKADLPIRGARAYAAMQEKDSDLDGEVAATDAEEDEHVEIPAQSVEDVEEGDAMDLD
jgi:RNA polymerase I-specific transcription initiation factor RRN5